MNTTPAPIPPAPIPPGRSDGAASDMQRAQTLNHLAATGMLSGASMAPARRVGGGGYNDDDDGDPEPLAGAAARYQEARTTFASLPTVQLITKQWIEKGLRPDDPVFLLVQMMSQYSSHQVQCFERLIAALEASDRVSARSLEILMDGARQMTESANVFRLLEPRLNLVSEQAVARAELDKSFLSALPSLRDALVAIRSLAEERVWREVLLRFLTVGLCLGCGVILGAILF